MNWKNIYKFLCSINLLIILIGGLCFNLFMEPSFSFGFLSGSMIVLINFHFMQKKIRSLYIKESVFTGNATSILLNFYFRLAIIGVIIYILLGKKVDPLGLVIGLSTHIMSIVILGIILRNKSPEGK